MMKNFTRKLADFLVNRRKPLFWFTVILAAVHLLLLPRVKINTDMTRYLPDSSPMKNGIRIMMDEFTGLSQPNQVRVMFRNVPAEEVRPLQKELSGISHVTGVTHTAGSKDYEKDGYFLYVLNTDAAAGSDEEKQITETLEKNFNKYDMVCASAGTAPSSVPGWIIAIALLMILAILIFMSASFAEPFLFFMTIGLAVLINMGSNVFLGSISETTNSIGALLQLVLSMDYSVILMNRYRQERKAMGDSSLADRIAAMKTAVASSFSAITSSALTTVAGMLVLLFMSFKIGGEVGFVLAKGVFISFLCIFTVLPALLLKLEPILNKTAKKIPALPVGWLAAFSYKARRVMPLVLGILFAILSLMKGSTQITFAFREPEPVSQVFPPDNQTVVLYDNQDAGQIYDLIQEIKTDTHIKNVLSTVTFQGAGGSPDAASPSPASSGISDLLQKISGQATSSFTGKSHSMMILMTSLPEEGEEAYTFMDQLDAMCRKYFSGKYYLIGNTPMAWEMHKGFSRELDRMTLLTAAAIFAVVFFTFKSVLVPFLLVLLIQTAVYATMVVIQLQGDSIYYLALLMVQSILMGATIDYAIVFTENYQEARRSLPVEQALKSSYSHSISTILTSGMIIVLITAVLGFAFPNPATGQICHTIAKGAASAIILILFVLPGVLAALDRQIISENKMKTR